MSHHTFDRRRFLRGSAAVGGGLVAASLPGGVWAQRAVADEDAVRVYVVIVDGLRPDQLGRMPFLSSLRDEGTLFPESRAQMLAETTPNHVAMLTGVRADRNGMPGNAVPGLDGRVSDDRRYLKADTLFTLAARQAPDLVTAAATSKDYVVETSKADRTGDRREDATATNDPVLSIPLSDAAPDVEVGADALRLSRDLDPDFLFVNLGDVDRVGHLDLSGGLSSALPTGAEPLVQQVALQTADLQIRLLVEELRRSGRWERTVLMVTADHSMDWSRPDRAVDLAAAFDDDPLLAGEVVVAVNGGACLYALRAPDEPAADERLRRMRAIASATDGVARALYLRPNPADGGDEHTVQRLHPDWGLGGDYTGELVVTVESGWRIGHGGSTSNPIPGNHGHEVTLPIPVLVAGGWDGVRRGQVVEPDGPVGSTDRAPNQAENIDLAATTAWLLGLNPPPGGFDGRVLTEAFDRRPAPRVPVAAVQSVPVTDRLGPDGPVAAAVAISREAFAPGGSRPAPGSFPMVTGDESDDDRVATGPVPAAAGDTVLLGPVDAPDHLVAAGPFGAALGAPLLLTPTDTLPGPVAEELRRLAPQRVVLLGGPDVLSDAVADAVEELGVEVDRFTGDAVAVAAHVARELGVSDANREVLLVAGADDAAAAQLAAERRARPVLLTREGTLPTATAEALDELAIDRLVVAGTALSPAVVAAQRDAGRLVEVIAARDGRDLPRRLAERAVREGALTDDLHLAADAATALAAAPALAQLRGSLLVLPPSGPVPSFVVDRSDEFVRVRYLGAVPDARRAEVDEAIARRRTRAAGEPAPTPAPPQGPPADPGSPTAPTDPPPAGDDVPPRAAATRPLPVTGGAPTLFGLGALGLAAALRARDPRRADRTDAG